MEHFILGILMMNKLTAYELHSLIKNNYQGICSYSIGNIQRALKKLHEKTFVSMEEVMEGKVVKKIFSITPVGRVNFMTWLNNPIDLLKAKNIEVGRLLLLGFLTKEQQLANIDIAIKDHKQAYEYLKAVEVAIEERLAKEEASGGHEQFMLDLYADNKEYFDELLDSVEEDDFLKLFASMSKFANLTLKLGIDETKFTLDWFVNLREELALEES